MSGQPTITNTCGCWPRFRNYFFSGRQNESSHSLEGIEMTELTQPLMRRPRDEPVYTYSVKQDLELLKKSGFIIDYPKGKLGTGLYGDVYRGVYGENAKELVDTKGEPLRNVSPDLPFAVKMIEFGEKESGIMLLIRMAQGNTQEAKRDSYETEKWILTRADHPNITPIRMAINMGEPDIYTNQSTGEQYIQHKRIYLIMDFANNGSLYSYLKKRGQNLTTNDRIKLTVDCFKGLKYLHELGVSHGDIHSGNVLIFEDETGITAKWADFGLGYISKKGEFKPFSDTNDWYLRKNRENDCFRFYNILFDLWKDSKPDNELDPILKDICLKFIDLQKDIRRIKDLGKVFDKYRDILE